eukprot:TRINITY_DN3087_c0_g1_i1.p1 TRINITY_DN3087_c0_g1~~TRINITY_DN3087_c0_g1_i1.p1  ORF type:complete len:106 (+),score=13.88 TRINITY_DN3087_c0_g1_i1:438-755(+)
MSIHSFTDCYEGQKREVEIGILYREDHLESVNVSKQIYTVLKEKGYDVRLNEPWPGAIMDVVKDANERGTIGVGFEFRQDLLQDPKWMTRLYENLLDAFKIILKE